MRPIDAAPIAIVCVDTASRDFAKNSADRLRFTMNLSAAHQPTGYVGRLQQRAFRRKMGSQIPGDGNKDMPLRQRGPKDDNSALSLLRALQEGWLTALMHGEELPIEYMQPKRSGSRSINHPRRSRMLQ